MPKCEVCRAKLNSYNKTGYCGAHQEVRIERLIEGSFEKELKKSRYERAWNTAKKLRMAQ